MKRDKTVLEPTRRFANKCEEEGLKRIKRCLYIRNEANNADCIRLHDHACTTLRLYDFHNAVH